MTRIAHLSDPHLDTGPARARRLERVLAQVRELGDIDLVLVSGDIADHGAAAEYEQFFDMVETVSQWVVVPGNHDRRGAMANFLAPAAGGRLNSLDAVDDLTVVGLDSLIEGDVAGRLTDDTIDFAREAIAHAPGPVLLALHHPPVPVGNTLMDGLGLREPDKLADLVESSDAVIAVLTGHVHTALATTFAGRPLLGAPGIVSTMRLGDHSDPIADAEAMPGLAVHTIQSDRSLTTRFHFLSPEE